MNTKTFALFLGSLFLFLFGTVLIINDWMGLVHVPPLTFASYLYIFLKVRLPLQLPLIVFLMLKFPLTSYWQTFFDAQVWTVPVLLLAGVAAWLNSGVDGLIGFEWSWIPVALWSLLFIAQLWLYQRGSLPAHFGFLLSFLGIYVANELYEVPALARDYSALTIGNVTGYVPLTICTALFVFLLWRFKFQFNPQILMLTLWPVLLEWIVYYQVPAWLVRFSVIPLFVYIAYKSKKVKP